MATNSTVKTRIKIEDNEGELALGLILTDQFLFSMFFQKNDLSLEPTVPQKLMICDNSKKILLCTSRNVAKSVSIIGRVVRDAVTFLPREGSREDEILVFTPAESHLQPLAQRIFAALSRQPMFRYLIKRWNRSTDKPLLETKNGLKIHFRIDGSSGTDTNMVGLHPHKIYGDECEYTNFVVHRSRAGGIQPGGTWLYAGVPNGVRNTPFYALDKGKEGVDWSKHKCSMLTANPLFLRSRKYRAEMVRMFGGKHSPDYITQVKGEWGDESLSSFPPGNLSFNREESYRYYARRLSGAEVYEAIKDNRLWTMLKVPSVKCLRAVIGWDNGGSPDPSTFMVAIQTEPNGQWKTYCRISLYSTPIPRQLEVLNVIWNQILDGRCVMMSLDDQTVYEFLLKDEYRSTFEGKIKLTRQGGTVDFDTVSGKIVTEFTENDPEVILHRSQNKIVKEYRKYWITEMLKRYMINHIMNKIDDVRLELGYDSDLESEFIGTVEMKTDRHTIYKVPRIGKNGVNADQIVDACRALTDCIMTIDAEHYREVPQDLSGMLAELGWTGGKRGEPMRLPWQAR